jgi:arsenite methyltransferase
LADELNNQPGFFDFAAQVGLTKHIGGLKATEALIEQCHIGKGSYVLDVGSGVGVTPCFLARKYGCRIVGVDISEQMVEKSRERSKREKVVGEVEFRILPWCVA